MILFPNNTIDRLGQFTLRPSRLSRQTLKGPTKLYHMEKNMIIAWYWRHGQLYAAEQRSISIAVHRLEKMSDAGQCYVNGVEVDGRMIDNDEYDSYIVNEKPAPTREVSGYRVFLLHPNSKDADYETPAYLGEFIFEDDAKEYAKRFPSDRVIIEPGTLTRITVRDML